MKKSHVNKTKGFTLVELLVVVTIISVLASIAAVSYSRFIKQSRDARRKTDIEQVRAAIELFRNFNGAYPTSQASPGLAFGVGALNDAAAVPTIQYMSKIPADPMPTPYKYYYTSTGSTYSLCVYLEGGGTASAYSCGTNSCNYCMGPYGQL